MPKPWSEIRPKKKCTRCKAEGRFWVLTEGSKTYYMCKFCGERELIIDMSHFGTLGLDFGP